MPTTIYFDNQVGKDGYLVMLHPNVLAISVGQKYKKTILSKLLILAQSTR